MMPLKAGAVPAMDAQARIASLLERQKRLRACVASISLDLAKLVNTMVYKMPGFIQERNDSIRAGLLRGESSTEVFYGLLTRKIPSHEIVTHSELEAFEKRINTAFFPFLKNQNREPFDKNVADRYCYWAFRDLCKEVWYEAVEREYKKLLLCEKENRRQNLLKENPGCSKKYAEGVHALPYTGECAENLANAELRGYQYLLDFFKQGLELFPKKGAPTQEEKGAPDAAWDLSRPVDYEQIALEFKEIFPEGQASWEKSQCKPQPKKKNAGCFTCFGHKRNPRPTKKNQPG